MVRAGRYPCGRHGWMAGKKGSTRALARRHTRERCVRLWVCACRLKYAKCGRATPGHAGEWKNSKGWRKAERGAGEPEEVGRRGREGEKRVCRWCCWTTSGTRGGSWRRQAGGRAVARAGRQSPGHAKLPRLLAPGDARRGRIVLAVSNASQYPLLLPLRSLRAEPWGVGELKSARPRPTGLSGDTLGSSCLLVELDTAADIDEPGICHKQSDLSSHHLGRTGNEPIPALSRASRQGKGQV
jgi:hypothetical protein